MKLKIEKDVKVAVQINGEAFITSEDGVLWERVEDDKAFFMIKSNKDEKEIKIQITKK